MKSFQAEYQRRGNIPNPFPSFILYSGRHNLCSNCSPRLSSQILQAESKQRKTLEHLSTQVTQYRKKLADQESQIQILSEKNSDLRVRLDRYARAKKKNGIVIPDSGLVGENDVDQSGPESTRPPGRAIGLNDESDAKSIDSSQRRSGKPFSPQAAIGLLRLISIAINKSGFIVFQIDFVNSVFLKL